MFISSSFKMVVFVTTLIKITFQSDPLLLNSVVTSELAIEENETSSEEEFDFQENDRQAVRPNYALDPRKTKRLAMVEQQLVNSLSDIQNEMSFLSEEEGNCHIYLSKYIHEFEQDTNATKGKSGESRANMIVDNPILTLKMIRRIVATLMKDVLSSCSEKFPEIGKTVNDTFTLGDLTPPTLEDLDDALLGLLRIQYIYGFNATNELRLGKLNDLYTEAFLYFDDCLALGKKAIEIEAQAMAYQWLTSAPMSPLEIDSPQEHIIEDMEDLDMAWLKLLNLTLTANWDKMQDMLREKRQDALETLFEPDYASYATCRGESTLPIKNQSTLDCFYNYDWDPYFLINPVKTEVLSENPVIFQFYDFVNGETIEFIRKSTDADMTRSEVIDSEEPQTDLDKNYRTSMSAWMYNIAEGDEDVNPLMVTLQRRIEKLTGLEVYKKEASEFQVVKYGSLGGHYDFHEDSLQDSTEPLREHGDRIATFLMFLSDVQMGGYTAFPDAGVFAKPIKGSALLWYPLKLNGLPDNTTSHGGCPVVMGTKEAANVWIFGYENMWKHPCSLNPKE